jgi:hypothetical protein
MANKAYYHREANPAHELFIVKTNEDKTVDLALEEKGTPIITGCVVTDVPAFGSCTLVPPTAPKQEETGEPLEESLPDAPAKSPKKQK